MHTTFPTLTFLPVESLLIHERHDDQRTRPLILRIQASGMLRNPPVVAPLMDGSERYMVLDGANRVTALRDMGYAHALVQVVQPQDGGLHLQTWNHVVWELAPSRFLVGLRDLPGVHLVPEPDSQAEPDLEGECGLALVKTCKGNIYSLCCDAIELEDRVQILHSVVDSYKERARLDRTLMREAGALADVYPQFSGLVIFPTFKIDQLLCLCGQGLLLPAGVTRFTISPRALHLNYPLAEIASDKSLEEKNADLQRWIQERLAKKGVRYYAEPTFLFDE